MNAWRKVLLTASSLSLLAITVVTTAGAAPLESSAPDWQQAGCRSVSDRVGQRWSFVGQVCWDHHRTAGGVTGPLRISGTVSEDGQQLVVLGGQGTDTFNFQGTETFNYLLSDITITVTGQHSTTLHLRPIEASSFGELINKFLGGVYVGIIGVLVA